MGKGKPREHTPYCERGTEIWFTRPALHICTECNYTMKHHGHNCPKCNGQGTIIRVGEQARVPKAHQKSKWKKFWRLFKEGLFHHVKNCR